MWKRSLVWRGCGMYDGVCSARQDINRALFHNHTFIGIGHMSPREAGVARRSRLRCGGISIMQYQEYNLTPFRYRSISRRLHSWWFNGDLLCSQYIGGRARLGGGSGSVDAAQSLFFVQ